MSLHPTLPSMARKRPGQLAVLHKAVACHLAYPMPCLLKESYLEELARYNKATFHPNPSCVQLGLTATAAMHHP